MPGRDAGADLEADPAALAEDIDHTRDEMSQTIDAIQERLEPEYLSAQAKDVAHYAIEEAKGAVRELASQATGAVREATVGRIEHVAAHTRHSAEHVKGDLLTTIKQNPVPAMLAAIGIGWLWTSRSSGSQGSSFGHTGGMSSDWDRRSAYLGAPYYGAYGVESGGREQSGGHVQQMAGQVASQVQGVAGQVQGVAGQVQNVAGQLPHQMQHQMQEKAGQVQHQAQGFWQMLEANPVAIGALGAVLGGVAGLMLPETERENQLMGQSRDRVIGSVQEVAGQTIEKVQRVAEEAGHTVMEEAKAQGMMPSGNSASGSSASAS
jgi:uncharacterized protein YjbJ (UPF0337 family)